jgi:hypothetical protein
MYNDTGLIIGTALVCFFGLCIAVVLPMLVTKQASNDDLPFDRAAIVRWMRILGWTLVVLSGGQLILFMFL